MRHKTARQLAEDLECDNVDDAFEFLRLLSTSTAKGVHTIAMAAFHSVTLTAQNQLLKFCSNTFTI